MAPNVPMNKWLRHFGLAALLSVPSVALADAVELPSSQELNFIKITDSYQLKPNTRYALMAPGTNGSPSSWSPMRATQPEAQISFPCASRRRP